jgi:hypothetical protein
MIALLYGLWPSWQTLLVVPRIILFSINGVSIGIVNGGGSAGGEHLAIVGGQRADGRARCRAEHPDA